MSDYHVIIKNDAYNKALKKYVLCAEHTFQSLKNDHVGLNNFINSREVETKCKNHFDELKKIVSEGGLDYDNFKK
jgi:hypothetical protein